MTTEIKETIPRASSGPLLAGPTKIRGWGRSSMTKLAFTGQALNGRSRQDLPAASDHFKSFRRSPRNVGLRRNRPSEGQAAVEQLGVSATIATSLG